MNGVEITDSAFGGTGTFERDGRHEEISEKVSEEVSITVAAPTPVPRDHEDVFSSVYVNAIGHSTMIGDRVTKFPEGSVIVREKLIGLTPELLTVMVKRGENFNPAGGDWEYLVLNGAGTEVRERGNLASCNSCHAQRKDSDFVFRTYLTEQDKLKQR